MANQDISELKKYKALLFDCYGVGSTLPPSLESPPAPCSGGSGSSAPTVTNETLN